jgi:hypothetical protein
MRAGCSLALTLFLVGLPASGAEDFLPDLHPLLFESSGLTFSVGGHAFGSLSQAFQPSASGVDKTLVSGAATVAPAVSYAFDDDTSVSFNGSFFVHTDRYSVDDYESTFVQKAYGKLATRYGTLEVGMTDGGSNALSVIGPVVDDHASLENHDAMFFPVPGGTANDYYAFDSAADISFNYAKIAYFTPEWHGFSFGVSFAPWAAKDVFPYVSAEPRHENRQKNIWEIGSAYSGSAGPFELSLYTGIGFSSADPKTATAGHDDQFEWAMGGEIAYPLTDDGKLSIGGAYHASNAYNFDPGSVLPDGRTSSAHLSAKYEVGAWSFGVEYSDGTAKGAVSDPVVGARGYGAAVSYALSKTLSMDVGWQALRYGGSTIYYNADTRLKLDAVFTHLCLNVE